MEIKYQLKPIQLSDNDETIEKTVYVIARCLSMSGFTINRYIYNELLPKEKELFNAQANLN